MKKITQNMINNARGGTMAAFALTYLGSIFGEAQTSTDGEIIAAFSYPGLPKNSDGTVPYAASLECSGRGLDGAGLALYLNDDLPERLWYQLQGYAAVHKIDIQ